mgnify:CR=1 FL=1
MTELEPGFFLKSRYQILQQIGKGGMGEVYLAEDQSLANQVAVKANHNLSAHAAEQFIREARMLAALKHPSLPRVIDYFTEGESQYLVMDYVPGEDLRTLIENKTSFTLPQVLKWAEQLGNALNYLHNQKPPIFHRDVKPANIKLTPAGDVVLVDFGIAKTGDPSQETLSGAWGYTPGFAPPEQVSGLRTGPYSDQFSLAATLYFLLAGTPPPDSAQRMMGSQEYIPLQTVKPGLPGHVCHAIDRALQIKPEERFGTITDFVNALCDTHPLPEPAPYQKTVVAANRPGIPPPPPQFTPPFVNNIQDKTRKSPVGLIIALCAVALLGIGGFFILKNLDVFSSSPARATLPPVVQTDSVAVSTTEEPALATSTPAVETETPTVTDVPAQTETTLPAYLPAGTGGKVAFVSNRQADGYFQIWMMDVVWDADGNLRGVNPVQVTFDEGDKAKPSFSPDGTKLIYSGYNGGRSSNGIPLEADIWLLDLSQTNPQPVDISLRAGNDWYAAWSPDGAKIAFTSYYREDKTPQLFLMNADGSSQTRLSDQWAESYAAWTPNGEFLLFVQSVNGVDALYMRDKFSLFDTSVYFDRSTVEGRLGLVSEPNMSLDGTLIAYTRTSGSKRNIFIAPYAERGGGVTQLTDSGVDSSPYWSPDGSMLLFTSERDGNGEIYGMDIASNTFFNLTDYPSQESDPAWQPVPAEINLPIP